MYWHASNVTYLQVYQFAPGSHPTGAFPYGYSKYDSMVVAIPKVEHSPKRLYLKNFANGQRLSMFTDGDVCVLMGYCMSLNNMNFIGSAFTIAGLQYMIQILPNIKCTCVWLSSVPKSLELVATPHKLSSSISTMCKLLSVSAWTVNGQMLSQCPEWTYIANKCHVWNAGVWFAPLSDRSAWT